MKSKKHRENKTKRNAKFVEDDLLFSSDENFAFIVGFTSNGVPFGITHEEMKEIEKEEISSNKKDDIDLPF
jgi:hypothetical protein